MNTAVETPPRTLDDILGLELAELVRVIVRGSREWARAKGASEEKAMLASIEAGRQWLDAFVDGETLFDMGPVTRATKEAPRGWRRHPGLPDPDEASMRYARNQMRVAAEAATAASNPPYVPPARALDLARQIKQLQLGRD
jgi:hypothetical protein